MHLLLNVKALWLIITEERIRSNTKIHWLPIATIFLRTISHESVLVLKQLRIYQSTKLAQRTRLQRKYLFLRNAIFKETKSRNRTIGEKMLKDNQNLVISHYAETEGTWLPYRNKLEKKLPKSLKHWSDSQQM